MFFTGLFCFRERSFLQYELYISTIALVSGGILFGIFASLLAIVNTAYNPIEAICHVPGNKTETFFHVFFALILINYCFFEISLQLVN